MTVAPDFAAPIVGWRMWVVVERPDGYRLESVFQPAQWTPRQELAASCMAPRRRRWPFARRRAVAHHVPDSSCLCGIYALKNVKAAAEFAFNTELRGRPVMGRALGTVALWGRLLECQRGWRAEFAYPIRIYVPADESFRTRAGLDELAFSLADYGVPVEIVSHWGDVDLLRSLASHSHI